MSDTRSRVPLLDSTFLRIETSDTPMHVAALQVFSLPEDAGSVAPAWDVVEQVDMEYHVRHTALGRR